MKLFTLAALTFLGASLAACDSLDHAAAHARHGMRRHSGFKQVRKNSGSSGSSSNSSSSGGFSSSKNGLGWPNGNTMSVESYSKTMGWLYSWDATPAQGNPTASWFIPSGISFYPMLWSNSGKRVEDWKKYVLNDRNSQQNKAKVAMGPNEVNQGGQGQMNPDQACQLFRQYLIPLKDEDGWKIIGASTNGAPDGIQWMKQFKSKCSDVYEKIDADSLHFYGTDPQKAIQYFQEWHNTFQKPIFITETACMNYDGSQTPNQSQANNFVKEVNQFAQKTDWIKGIAFYGIMKQLNINAVNRLASSGGSPTSLFETWVSTTNNN